MASEAGHTAIIVALVEEGSADVNKKGGLKGDTALMLSVSGKILQVIDVSQCSCHGCHVAMDAVLPWMLCHHGWCVSMDTVL